MPLYYILYYILFIFSGYLIGSLPFGYLLTYWKTKQDVRLSGSGGTGATNVLRTGGKSLAFLTLLLDGLKGYAVTILPNIIYCGIIVTDSDLCANHSNIQTLSYVTSIFALIGHIFPVWLKFKGGKGIAPCLGILIAIEPLLAGSLLTIWILSAVLTKYSSLSSLIAALSLPILAHLFNLDAFLGYFSLLTLMILYTHRQNIIRLLKGKEPKIGQKV